MNEYDVVILIAFVELVMLVTMSAWYLARGWFHTHYRRTRRAVFEDSMLILSKMLATGRQSLPPKDLKLIRRLGRGAQISLFTKIAAIVAPRDRVGVQHIARGLGLLELVEKQARSRTWWRRLEAVRFLSTVGSQALTPLEFINDERLEIRAQAVEWAGAEGDERYISSLIEVLGDPSGLCRYTVQDALLRAGHEAAAPLAAYLQRPLEDEQVIAALRVAQGIADATFLETALALTRHSTPEIRASAATTLGAIGGKRSIERLQELTGDDSAEVRTDAISSLARIGGPSVAGSLADHLTDKSWNVRRAAALSLCDMGAPGQILLRNARKSPDRFARDMATLVLEIVPGSPE